jgi:hypothetical protein
MSSIIMPSASGISGMQNVQAAYVYPVCIPGRKWNRDVQIYTESQTVPVTMGCFSFMFTNVGAVIGFVGGMIVHPSATPLTALGDSRSLSGHVMDLYAGTLDLKFNTGAGAAIEIVQLFYIL